jgi:heterogeneous nuclear rnp K-like protein 2
MPETDLNRKRSRSPSDSEPPKQHKRANTGPTPSASDEGPNATTAYPSADVTMTDTPGSAEDNAGSTPGSNNGQTKDGKSDDGSRGGKTSSATTSGEPSSSTSAAPAPSAHIHMRCLIVTQDASIIIGKGGSHVNEIREKSGARVMVSESIPGNPERILNVSGPLDAVSKVSFISFINECEELNSHVRLLALSFAVLTTNHLMCPLFLGVERLPLSL